MDGERNVAIAWKTIAYDPHKVFVIPRIPPDQLTARVLTPQEQQVLHSLCQEILLQSELAKMP